MNAVKNSSMQVLSARSPFCHSLSNYMRIVSDRNEFPGVENSSIQNANSDKKEHHTEAPLQSTIERNTKIQRTCILADTEWNRLGKRKVIFQMTYAQFFVRFSILPVSICHSYSIFLMLLLLLITIFFFFPFE